MGIVSNTNTMHGGGVKRGLILLFFVFVCTAGVSFARFEVVECISWGGPTNGKLINADKLTAGEGYYIKSDSNTYGTPETIEGILEAISHVKSLYPNAHDLVIGDFSKPKGGHYSPHLSHESGVDADIGYYLKDMGQPTTFVDANSWMLDAEKTWALIEALTSCDKVKYIFMDYPLQRVLYFYALKKGVPRAELSRIFQYPRGYYVNVGIIRHLRGHRDHMHVRFISSHAVMVAEKYTTDELRRMHDTQPSGGKVAFDDGEIVPVGRVVWYRVKNGETYYSIADKYQVSVTQLKLWNKGNKFLKAGEEVAIYQPATGSSIVEAADSSKEQAKTYSLPKINLSLYLNHSGVNTPEQMFLGSYFFLRPRLRLPLP